MSGDHGRWRRRGRCYTAGHPHTPTCHGGSRSPMLEKKYCVPKGYEACNKRYSCKSLAYFAYWSM